MIRNTSGLRIRAFILLLCGSVFYGIGIAMFVEPANIAPGGAAGVALMIGHLCQVPVGVLTLLLNIPLLILSWLFLDHRFTWMTAAASTVCSLLLDFIISPIFPVYEGDRLLGSLCGGLLVGIGMALIFQAGMSTGGTDILGYLIQKKWPHISIGRALLFVDSMILAASVFVFGDLEAAIFGVVALYVQTKVIDTVIYGVNAGSMVTIITKNATGISGRIIKELDRTATLLPGRGAFSGEELEVLMCTVRKTEFASLKRIVSESDPGAFFMVMETSDVFGNGFKKFAG